MTHQASLFPKILSINAVAGMKWQFILAGFRIIYNDYKKIWSVFQKLGGLYLVRFLVKLMICYRPRTIIFYTDV